MSKTIAVLGAGPGLGRAVARRYARGGYTVALVARHLEPIEELATQLQADGAQAYAITGDLSDTASIPALAHELRNDVGEPDVLYYGPTPGSNQQPTAGPPVRPGRLTEQQVASYLPTSLSSLIALVGEFLPGMLERQNGAVLAAGGASAVRGVPYFCAPGPALAAQRNYLQSLETELADTGVFVGRLYIGATIRDSAWHRQLQSQQAAGQAAHRSDPVVDPDDLADILWTMQHSTRESETVYPAVPGSNRISAESSAER